MIATETIWNENTSYFTNMLTESARIYDQALYFLRQAYFKCKKEETTLKTPSITELYSLVKDTESFRSSGLDHVIKTSCINQAGVAWSSWIKSLIRYKQSKSGYLSAPNIPCYLHKRKTSNIVSIDKTRLRKKDCGFNQVRLPKSNILISIPSYIEKTSIKCIRILEKHNKIKIEIVYEKPEHLKITKTNRSIGIDLGLSNLCAITTNDEGFSRIVKGGTIKSINQYYNKTLAELQSKLPKGQFTSNRIKSLTHKREMKIHSYFHLVSRRIIDLCKKEGIDKIVIGHNKGQKQSIGLGVKTNQKFVQIPFCKLIQMLKYKAEELGIEFIETEESYTSKIDHSSLETMEYHDTYKGSRVKRGMFKTVNGKFINADINGALGILRKVNAITDAELKGLSNRGDVVSPLRIFL